MLISEGQAEDVMKPLRLLARVCREKKRFAYALLLVLLACVVLARQYIFYWYYSHVHAYDISIYETIADNSRPREFIGSPFELSSVEINGSNESAVRTDEQLSKIRLNSEHRCHCRWDQAVELTKFTRDNGRANFYQVDVFINNDRISRSYEISEAEFESSILTCGLYDSLRRGPKQKVLAYSLYGNNSFYYEKLANLTRIINEKYPGWTMRVYYDDATVNLDIICQIECSQKHEGGLLDNVDFCNINKIPYDLMSTWSATYMHGMTWRWLPIGDSFVEVFSSRDSDSYILERELASVKEWLASNTLFHIMRDNKGHNTHILGGLWGFANSRDRRLSRRLFNSLTNPVIAKNYNENDRDRKGYDQFYLTDFVWPFAKLNSTTHDSFWCQSYENSQPFPTKRLNAECFVGSPDICDEKLASTTLNRAAFCPVECRPQIHLDWFYC